LTSYFPGTRAVRHELTFLNVFRVIQALVYVSLAFTPLGLGWPQLSTLNI
jgi:two-component system sensor histidine kinase PilS (NtrC family)